MFKQGLLIKATAIEKLIILRVNMKKKKRETQNQTDLLVIRENYSCFKHLFANTSKLL